MTDAFGLSKATKESLKLYNEVPEQHKHLICADDSELIALANAATPPEAIVIPPSRPLTRTQEAEQNGRLNFEKIFGCTEDEISVDPAGDDENFQLVSPRPSSSPLAAWIEGGCGGAREACSGTAQSVRKSQSR